MDAKQSMSDLRLQLDGLRHELAALRTELSQGLQECREDLLALRYHACRNRPGAAGVPPPADMNEVVSLDDQFEKLRQIVPSAFPVWRSLLDVNADTYEGFPTHSCSVAGHPMARLFKFFLTPYLAGRVLDIGCGPQPVPLYLEGHPLGAVYGIDPISRPQDHPFTFVRSVAEFLPWEDGQFDTVIAATSLDHVLLLDQTLQEVQRVLTPGGTFVVWAGFVEGAKPYNPYRTDIEKVDDWHLFHFAEDGFGEAFAPFFVCEERFVACRPYSSCFVAFRTRK